jgi:predicted kinase
VRSTHDLVVVTDGCRRQERPLIGARAKPQTRYRPSQNAVGSKYQTVGSAMQDHLVHLICGSTGAGKTTYALQLCEQLRAVRFSIDEWMTGLFWMDAPQPLDADWAMERVERCYRQIWVTASQVAARRVPCVLDLGFAQAKSRARFAGLASGVGASAQLHFIDVPLEERWRRVESRNARKGETHQLRFEVTRAMFDYVESLWEPPTAKEMDACNGVRVTL